MGINYNCKINTDGLVMHLDAGNIKSYSGTGQNWRDVVSNSVYSNSAYAYPSSGISGSNRYFTFVNNGIIQNNVYSGSNSVFTSTDMTYTRLAWFYLSGTNEWSPIIQNQAGNNTDMGLTISGGKLHFRQYVNSYTNGTTSGDYGVSGSLTVSTNTWYQAAIVVTRYSNTVSFYLNGVLDSTVAINPIGNSGSNNIVIGGAYVDGYGGGRMFKGNISMVSHYNRILNASEIQQNFQTHRGRFGI